MSNKFIKVACAGILSAGFLAACGGGGGGGDSDTTSATGGDGGGSTSPVTGVGPFTKYEGTWGQGCDFHERDTTTLTASSGGKSLAITSKTEYFANEDCTGAIVATGTYAQPQVAMQYTKTEANAPVKMLTGEIVTASVDVGTAVGSGEAIHFTGSGVTSSIVNGKTVWHIVFNNGYTDLTVDDSPGTAQGALLLLNDELLVLLPVNNSATSFNVDSRYIR